MNTITRAIDTIEVGTLKNNTPILLDLNLVFGAIDLNYSVAVGSYGVVSILESAKPGELYVAAGEHARVGGRTRLVIHASDGKGCNATVVFNVEIIADAAVIESRVA